MNCDLCTAAAAGHLCARHVEQLDTSLRELPDLYAEVAEFLVPRSRGLGEIVSTRAAAGPQSPINEDVLDVVTYARAAEVIRSWRADVRRVRWPHRTTPLPVGGLAADGAWLIRNLEWIAAEYPAAGDLATEVRELERQARSVVGDPLPRVQRIGLCVAAVGVEGAPCGAVLSRLPGEPVRCRWCGAEYRTEQELLALLHCQPRASA